MTTPHIFMPNPSPNGLSGCTVLNTRPLHQHISLSSAIAQLGGQCIHLPCLHITGPDSDTLAQLKNITCKPTDTLIFTSTNAVKHALAHLHIPLGHKHVFAIGPATANMLNTDHIHAHVPTGTPGSRNLLKHPALQVLTGHTVTIVTGENTKPLLQQVLTTRGATVRLLSVYQRTGPDANTIATFALRSPTLDAMISTSSEGLQQLANIVHSQALIHYYQCTLLVINDSMKKLARQLGFSGTILVSPSAQTTEICRTLLTWYRTGAL